MARMIAAKLLDQEKISDDMVIVSSRNDGKTGELRKLYPNVACQSAEELAKQCGLIFICVPPMAVKETLEKIQPLLQEDVHIVSIAAGIELDRLHDWTSGQVTRYIPTLTSEVGIGVSLVVHGERVAEADKSRLEEYLSAFSTVKQIHERDIDAASNLTSSSPGFITSIFEEFVQAAVRNSSLTKEEAFHFLIHALLGTGKLLMEKDMTFAQTLDRVATKGGITAEGAEVIQDAMPEVFDELFARTMKKYEDIKGAVRRQ